MANREGVQLSAEDGQVIRARYEAGEGIASLRAAYRTSNRRIEAAIRAAGGTIRPTAVVAKVRSERRTLPPDEARDDVTTRYMRGESLRTIAEDYGVTHPTIRAALMRWGVIPDTRKPRRTQRNARSG